METCCRARTVSSLWGLVQHPKDLLLLVFRILPKLLGFPPSLQEKFRKGQHVVRQPPRMELETLVGRLPELPQDIVELILANLQIPDLVRAGSVSSSWHAAYTSLRDLGKYKKSQTPCLLYTSESAGDNVACLYSLAEKREYKLTLPEPPIRSRFLIGSSDGWLITADEACEVHLVNPLTGEQIALPSVVTIEHLKPRFDASGNIHEYEHLKPHFDASGSIHEYELSYYTGEKVYRTEPDIYALNDLRDYLYFKAFVFPDSFTGSYIVVLIHNPYCQLSFARAGDDKWTWLPPNAGYRDCVYMDGLLYALTSVGEIDAFDFSGSTVTRKVITGKVKDYIYESMYIIPAPWGGLLQVWRAVDIPKHRVLDEPAIIYHPDHKVWRVVNHPEYELEIDAPGILKHPEQADDEIDAPEHGPASNVLYVTQKIVVYNVDMAAKELVKIKRLPRHVLFLGHNQSLCLDAEEHPQLKSNHAYFTDDHEELIMISKNVTRDIGVLNLEDCRRKEIVSKDWSDWPRPTWITPKLSRMSLALRK